MKNENAVRVDGSQSTNRAARQRRATRAKPYTQFARSGVWRFRSNEPFRPFKPFRLD